ncbi:MAG: hypothetical protein P8Y78_06025 [Acidihalobacter sp.]
MSAQLLHEQPTIDWREVIAGKDAMPRGDEGPGSRGRRELGLGKAIVIAAGIEILAGVLVALILAWPHPHHHKRSRSTPLQVHLVSTAVHAPRHAAQGANRKNPSAGRQGSRSQADKAHVSGGSAAGVVAAVSASKGLTISRISDASSRKKGGAHIRLNADCVSAQAGCLNERELRRYLQRLHAILQQRLAGLVKRDLPLGSESVVLRFVGNPGGGHPARIDVLQAPAASDAGRRLRLALQDVPLPPYPKGLGGRALSFKVALHAGGG